MSTTSITAALESVTTEIEQIGTQIEALEARLEELTTAKDALEKASEVLTDDMMALISGVTESDEKPAKSKSSSTKDTDQSTQRGKIIALLAQGIKPKEIAEKLNTHTSYVYTVKRSMTEAEKQPVKTSSKSSTKNNGSNGKSNGNGETQRQKIEALLAKGMKPSAIAKELNTHVSYVYTVKNS